MKMKKLKKRPKRILIILLLIIILIVSGIISYKSFIQNNKVKEAKVVSKINNYGYSLKSNKSSAYKKLFNNLKEVLSAKKVNEKEYAKIITKMFIVDFYSLNDKTAKTDVGGVEFIHKDALDNFILKAEDTLYKYIESDIYGQRKQKLPIVDKITIESIEKTEFSYLEEIDEEAYKVKASWTYKNPTIANDYQTENTFIFVHDGKKLVLVEITDDDQE